MDWVQQLSKGTDERLGVSAPAIQTTCLLHCLYLCLPDPVRFSVYVFVHLSVYLSFAYLNVFLSVCVCLCWSVFLYFMAFSSCPPGCEPRLSVCRSVGLSTCLSSFIYVCLFCRLSVYLSFCSCIYICTSVRLAIRLSACLFSVDNRTLCLCSMFRNNCIAGNTVVTSLLLYSTRLALVFEGH